MHLWDDPYLYRVCQDGMLRRCVPMNEAVKIMEKCHGAEYGGHYGAFRTHAKIWQSGFYWPTMYEDTKDFVKKCARCQKHGNINTRDAMPLTNNLQVELFDAWGIDYMGPFPHRKVVSTSWWQWTMCPNGWKQYLAEQLTPSMQGKCLRKSYSHGLAPQD